MNKRAVLYARVSLEIQTKNDAKSINQQLSQMKQLCGHNSWEVMSSFIDTKNYRATLPPKKGKIVNPSGERADRPQFLAMLERIKAGDIDIVLCWRDDRLVRHPRVAVALEDALDVGDSQRRNGNKIEVRDATGALIDRFTLSIKATIWREENKRKAERSKMGKIASLQAGRWPGTYRRHGYKSIKIPGKRGRKVVLDPVTAPIVRKIFEMYDSGKRIFEIREHLIGMNAPQIYTTLVKHDWSMPLINRMLRKDAYLGKATWTFNDGTVFEIAIPQIIEPALWKRVQAKIERNKTLSTRNAKGIYLLQGLIYCGDCGNGISVTRRSNYGGGYGYRCHTACHNPQEDHPKPYNHHGTNLDWAFWRYIVDNCLQKPEMIRRQIEEKILELQNNQESVDENFEHIQMRLSEIESERAFYQKKAAQNKITEEEFDTRMGETEERKNYWMAEHERLFVLKHDKENVRKSIDYAEAVFEAIRIGIVNLDQNPDELRSLPESKRREILKDRRAIIRALVDRVTIDSTRRVTIEGVIDGSEGVQFDLQWS